MNDLLLCKQSSNFLALVAAECMIKKGETETHDGSGKETRKDKLFFHLKLNKQLSRGEICVANFISPVNGASPSSLLVRKVIKKFSPFCFDSPEIIGVEFHDRQKDKFFDTICGWVWIFFQSKFSTSLLTSLAGG